MGPETELHNYFTGPKHCETGAKGGLDEKDVAFIEDTLDKWRLGGVVKVNRAKLTTSCEAWVHALVKRDEGSASTGLFAGFAPYPREAVITWCNSD